MELESQLLLVCATDQWQATSTIDVTTAVAEVCHLRVWRPLNDLQDKDKNTILCTFSTQSMIHIPDNTTNAAVVTNYTDC